MKFYLTSDQIVAKSKSLKTSSLFRIRLEKFKKVIAKNLILAFFGYIGDPKKIYRMDEIIEEGKMKREVGLLDAVSLVAGTMIGSGIFIVSADITRHVGSAGWLIGIWVITGIMTLIAAVSYGELGAMFPKAGGQYLFLKEAYSDFVGFLYGWSFFTVIQTGSIAAVGVAFAKFTSYLIPQISEEVILMSAGPLQISSAQLLSLSIIILLTYINTRGAKDGKTVQTFLTVIKIASLIGIIIFGFWALKPEVWANNWQNAWTMQKMNVDGSFESYTIVATLGAIAAAMVGSVFSSDSWHCATSIAGEIKNPQRNVGLSLFIGALTVITIYIIINIVYLGVLPLNEIAFAKSDRVGVAAADIIFGSTGTIIIAVMIMISCFGCVNGLILAGPRVYYTMAKDGLFFEKVAHLNKNGVPGFGLWIQCLVACALCLSGKYSDLLNMVSFVVVLFYILNVVGIYRLRITRPDAVRPYKAFGYPVLPAVYILLASAFCLLLVFYKPNFTWPGLIIVLTGVPIYLLWKRKK